MKTKFTKILILCLIAGALPLKLDAATVKAPTTNGLVGYWSFDEGKGLKAGDYSGKRNTGTISGATWVNGKRGKALSFNGLSGVASVASYSNLNPGTGDFTLSLWIKTSGFGDLIQAANGNAGNTTLGYALVIPADWGCSTNGQLYFNMSNGASRDTGFCSNAIVNNNQWHHVSVAVVRGSNVKYYIDGNLDNTLGSSLAGSITLPEFWLGQIAWQGWYGGQMDEVRVYNRALSATEIQTLYVAGGGVLKAANKTGLVGYWNFDEGRGNKAGDSSGQRNNGNISGATWVNGKRGKALSFTGTNNVLVPDSPALRVSNNFTISLWFKSPSTSQTNKYLLARNESSGNKQSAIIYEYVNNQIEFFAQGYSGVDPRTNSQMTVADTNWHHIVYAYNGSNWSGYLDGTNIFSVNRTFSLNADALDGWYIGNSKSGGTAGPGTIDEVRIYNRALSAAEISNLYLTGSEMVNASPAARLTDGLVGYWTFDGKDYNSASTTAEVLDRSGYNNHGNNISAVPTVGKVGQGMDFSSPSRVTVSPSASLNNLSALTLSLWINPKTDTVSWKSLIRKSDAGGEDTGWGLDFYPDSASKRLYFVGTFDGTHVVKKVNGNFLSYDKWQHVAVTWNGSTASSDIRIYVNGAEVTPSWSTTEGSGNRDDDSSYNLSIGADNIGGWPFKGKLDEVRVYNRALSASEVKQLYLMGK